MQPRVFFGMLIVLILIMLTACSSLDEGTLTTDTSTSAQAPVVSESNTAQSPPQTDVAGGASTVSSSPQSSTPSIAVQIQLSPKGTRTSLQDWCRKIITPNLDPQQGSIRKIIGNEQKVILGTAVDLCHYSSSNINLSTHTDTWETQKGKYPYYKFDESFVGGSLASNHLEVAKKEEGKKIKCDAANIDVANADAPLRCE